MQVRLHANATTTPRTRAYIQKCTAPVAQIARELGVSETTVRRWKPRTTVADGSHVAHRLAVSLTDLEQRLVLELRMALQLPLDDIVEVMRRCVNPKLSRSAVHRCLKRHGVSAHPKPARRQVGTFEAAGVGFIHVDLKHLTRLNGQPSFVFVAIDRATRFVHIESIARRDAATVAACLERFIAAFPHKVHTILTDNGSEFTDRFGGAKWRVQRTPTGRHHFDRVCARHGIEHRLIRPFRPQTNGLVERFNRRLAEAIATKASVARNEGKNKFLTHAERNAFLQSFVANYNRTRLKCLDYKAPEELLLNPPGPNTKAGTAARSTSARRLSRARSSGQRRGRLLLFARPLPRAGAACRHH
jgi:transposase InsO family protein